jgi:hypothetical protein
MANVALHWTSMLLLGTIPATAARLSPLAERAFDKYAAQVEARLAEASRSTMIAREGVEPMNGGSWPVTGGRLHHWRATTLIPGAKPKDLLTLLEDYDHLAKYYSPEVVSSRASTGDDEGSTVLMRFRKHRVITVVLDAEFDTLSVLSGSGTRGFSLSRSRHIWQVDYPGSPRERRRIEGDDDGFLWRLNSYWDFEETKEGLLVECEAISLTRDVPTGLGWLIVPIVQTLPRESLEFTLAATSQALTKGGSGLDRDH